jgi:glycosylphosphatidylinositol transamidase
MLMHPHSEYKQQFTAYIQKRFPQMPSYMEQWAVSMCDLVLFSRTLFEGPYGAHSLALDRGIDALTIEGRCEAAGNAKTSQFVVDYAQKLEITIRALSNLHERLHHSTTLYLLPSPGKFVKHEEYLIPNLLLLIPMVTRAATLAFYDIQSFHLGVMGWMVFITFGATLWIDTLVTEEQQNTGNDPTPRNTWLAVTYVACFALFYEQVLRHRWSLGSKRLRWDGRSAIQSAQLIICLVGIYVHVPICFGHVSLAYPSALFWAPWLAFPSYGDWYRRSKFLALMSSTFVVLSWPPVAPLPVFSSTCCPPYVRFVYYPLHLLLSLSCLLGLVAGRDSQQSKGSP